MKMISRLGSLCTTLLLCAMALGMTALSAEANVSGSISYAGSKTGPVYLVMQPQGNFGQGSSLGSSVAPQGTSYGIAGVPDGTYNLYAYMDTVGNGLLHASNPMAGPITVVVNGGNGTANVTLADPLTFTPAAPDTFNAIPTPCGTFMMWDPPRDPNTQALVADRYNIYWSTSPQFTPQTAQGSKLDIPADGNESFYVHNGSGTFYYLMTAKSGANVSAPSAIVGPLTIPAAPAAGNTVSGKFILDKSTLPGFTPTGTLYVVVTDDNGKFYFSKIASPTFANNEQAFSVPGVTNGSYFIYYFVDMNDDGLLTFGDLSDNGPSPFITVNNGNLTVPDITLKAVNAATRVTTYHGRNISGDFYFSNVRVEGVLKQPVNVALTGKPSSVPTQVPMEIGIDPWEGGFGYGLYYSTGKAAVGDLYTFDITYPGSTDTGVQAAVTGVLDSFSTPVAPRGFVVVPAEGEIIPTLTWTVPAPALSGSYTYNLWLNQQSSNGDNGWWVDALPAGTTSVPYNFDGGAPPLSLGTVYQWGVRVNDANGNESELQDLYTFMPVTAIPVPQITSFGPGSGAEGSSVTIFGTDFSSDPAANQVLFFDGSANTLPGTIVFADFNQLQVAVPQGAQSGPITVRNDPSAQPVTTAGTFIVTAPQSPFINSFSPGSGAIGAQVTIFGYNFNPNAGATTVKFTNNITASISSISESQIVVTVPNGAATGPISVTTAGGTATSFSNFTVTVPISFSGFVKTSTGSPVAGAALQVVGNAALNAVSAADGSFSISNIPPGQNFTLKATAPGFTDIYYGPQGSTSNISGRILTFYTAAETATWGLSASAGAITGKVVAPGAGVPLQGATVNIVSPAGKYAVSYEGGGSSTNSTGAFRINGVNTSDSVTVTATKAGWTFTGQRVFTVYGNGVTEGNLGATTISYAGSLKDSAGVAVGSAPIEMAGYPTIITTTAGDGSFTLASLPSGNDFTLKMSKSGFVPTYSSITYSTTNITQTSYVVYTAAEIANWGVTPGKGAIRSRVTDNSPTPGVNLEGAVVTATSTLHPQAPYQVVYFDGNSYGGTSTFSNGVYVVKDVDEGDTVTVTATKTGYSFSTRRFITHADAVSMARITGTNQPVITPSPGSLSFGSVGTGSTSQSKTLTLTNTGASTLTVTGSDMIGPDPDMFIVNPGSTNPCPEQLPADFLPGQSCNLSVSFSPTSAGVKNATLTINSNDPTKPTLSVLLSGTGTGIATSPVITGFTPAGGPAGSIVTISGSSFDATPGNNAVQFNGAPATIMNASATQLTVIVPDNATSGPVTVSTVNGLATGASFTVTSPTIGPYTVSGTVSYAGSKTGRVYLALQGNGNYGTSVATAGSAFTIRGVQPGNYTLKAFMDTVGNSMQHGADPAVTIGNVSVTNAAIVINPTLVDPASVTPQTPSGLNVAPGNGGAFIQWDSPRDQNGVTIADSYRVYWGTTPSFTPQSATGSTPNMPGDDNNFFFATLTNGTYYFLITAASGANVSSPSGIVGPIVIGPPAGGTTVTVPVNIGFTPTGPLYIAVHEDASNKMFIAAVTAPAASNNVAVVGVTNGTYQVHAIVDMNNDGMLDAGDVVNDSNGIGIQVTVNNAPVTTTAISLAMQNVLATVQTNRFAGSGFSGHNLNFNVRRMAKQPVAVTLAAGPASTSYPVDIALSAQNGEFFTWVPLLTGTPVVGDSYTLAVAYTDGTSENIPVTITGVLNTFPTPIAPVGFVTGAGNTTPTFSWAAPTPPPAGTYAYSLWLSSSNGGDIWNREDIPGNQTSVLFNDDNSAQQSSLTLGTTYYWSIAVRDANGNTASVQTAFVPVITVPAPVINGFSNFNGNPGDEVIIYGNNFYPVPASNQVAFTSGTGTVQAIVTAAYMTSLTVIVPVGATTGPIRVTTAGGTATSPFAFNISQFQLTTSITGSGTVNNVNQSGPAFSCASANCVNSFSAGSSFTLHASPSANYTFGGWTGCGSIDGNGDCLVTLNGNATVTATFNMIPLVQVVGNSTPYQMLQEAYDGASSGAVLKARNITYGDNGLTMNRGIAVTVKGGLQPDFTTVNGYSYLPGVLTLMTGSLTAENLVVK